MLLAWILAKDYALLFFSFFSSFLIGLGWAISGSTDLLYFFFSITVWLWLEQFSLSTISSIFLLSLS